MIVERPKFRRPEGRMNALVGIRWHTALTLPVVAGTLVALMPETALAATASRLPKSLWSALGSVAGMALVIAAVPGLGSAIYLAVRRIWFAVGIPVLAVLPFSAFFQWQNPAIANPAFKLLAVIFSLAAVGLLSAAGIGLAKLLLKEADRIGAGATALATALPLMLGAIGPVGSILMIGIVSQSSPPDALEPTLVLVAAGLVATTYPLARLSRSVAGTTLGTSAGLLLLALWPVAISNATDAGQGFLVIFLLIPLMPLVLLLARTGAKRADNRPATR